MRGAAGISKGDIEVMTLSEGDVERHLDLRALLDGLAVGFRDLAAHRIQSPPRPEITVPGQGFMLSMPAWRPGGPMMVKMVCVFEGNLSVGLPNHLALINLFDASTGAPLCVMDGTYITGIRTAASAVLSVDLLARRDAAIATIIGAGVQGREHLRMLPLIREFDEIQVVSLYPEDAEALAEGNKNAKPVTDVRAAVRRSDVVCLASHAYTPVIDADWVRPGTHVSSVGYAPPRGELPPELARENRLFVEDTAAFAAPPVGCAELNGMAPSHGTALGEILVGGANGRLNRDEITVYKAMGIAMEDLIAAELVFNAALDDPAKSKVTI